MADKLTTEQRSAIMSRIRSKNTKPEIAVRKFLHSRGFRFRLHDKKLPGTPDIVLPKYRTAIFVNGCLWHGHFWCARYRMPKSNRDYWLAKIRSNKRRDSVNACSLMRDGWKAIVVWECETARTEVLEARLAPLKTARSRREPLRISIRRAIADKQTLWGFAFRSLAARIFRQLKNVAERIVKAILPAKTRHPRKSAQRKGGSRKRT